MLSFYLNKIIHSSDPGQCPGLRKLAGNFLLLGMLVLLPLIAFPQINGSEYGYLYISGQVTNETSGAPVSNHTLWIESDLSYNPSFSYSKSLVTNEYGFYYDTIQTTCDQGSLVFITYDIDSVQYKNQAYFRFYWEATAHIVAEDLKIYDPATNNDFQANFVAVKDSAGTLLYIFTDNSVGENIRTWEWDFGDNSPVSHEQNPQHSYAEPGVYNVSLTISNKITHDDFYDVSTITKDVLVVERDYYHLGGHAKIGGFPIDIGSAYLYKFDSADNLIPLDTAIIDTLGYYFFAQILEGKYITRVQIQGQSVYYDNYLPTYYGDKLNWESAEVINLFSTNWECDINLIRRTDLNNGDGLIQGNIAYGSGENPEFTPAEGISIMLLDPDDICTHYIQSDLNGSFAFNALPMGTYKVHAEIPGKHTIPAIVTLDANNTNFNELILIILSNQITFDINETGSLFIKEAGDIFPNPCTSHARIYLEGTANSSCQAMILNQTGQQVFSENIHLSAGSNQILFNTTGLPVGLYQVVLISEDNAIITQKLIKTNY
ncbi:MAG: PKD domain-containing protein [Bacteroidetes bacterium]|nr:PKD domain-containing protein [Bacteroidota bacterium]